MKLLLGSLGFDPGLLDFKCSILALDQIKLSLQWINFR